VAIIRSAKLPIGLYILLALISSFFIYLARSANWPEGLCILPSVVSFFFLI